MHILRALTAKGRESDFYLLPEEKAEDGPFLAHSADTPKSPPDRSELAPVRLGSQALLTFARNLLELGYLPVDIDVRDSQFQRLPAKESERLSDKYVELIEAGDVAEILRRLQVEDAGRVVVSVDVLAPSPRRWRFSIAQGGEAAIGREAAEKLREDLPEALSGVA